MKAVCNFTSVAKMNLPGGSFRTPAVLTPLFGKPFIQHIIEYIERLGADTVSIYLSEYADMMEKFLGDGQRWGISISYQLVKEPGLVRTRIRNSRFIDPGEQFLMCSGLQLPLITPEHLKSSCRFVKKGKKNTASRWYWGTLEELLEEQYAQEAAVEAYSVESPEDVLSSLKLALRSGGEGLIFFGKKIRDGIWTGPGCRISPAATLNPPLYIDSQVSVGDDAIIGPFAEIGRGTVVDSGSFITESSVLPGSYIGKQLDLRRCLVSQNQVLNVDLMSVYSSSDAFLLSPVDSREQVREKSFVPFASRVIALVLALATVPLQLLLLLLSWMNPKKPPYRFTGVVAAQVRPEGSPDPPLTRTMRQLRSRNHTSRILLCHLLWITIPGLWQVAAGRMRFFGIPPKSIEEFSLMSRDWQNMYLRSVPGLIAEADIIFSEYPLDETLFAVEMFYRANDSFRYNARLFGRYLRALVLGRRL